MNRLPNTISLPNVFSVDTGKSLYSVGYKSINQSIKYLLMTTKGELLGDPLFGTSLRSLLYEYNNTVLETLVKEEIVYSVGTYESRVEMTTNDIDIVRDGNTLHINIRYTIIKTGSSEEIQLRMLGEDIIVTRG